MLGPVHSSSPEQLSNLFIPLHHYFSQFYRKCLPTGSTSESFVTWGHPHLANL